MQHLTAYISTTCILLLYLPISYCQLENAEIGHKLEACFDPRQPDSPYAAATIVAIDKVHKLVTVTYDGFPPLYEMDIALNDECLRPVGYNEYMGQVLKETTIPLIVTYGEDGTQHKQQFDWAQYLRDTNTLSVPYELFSSRQRDPMPSALADDSRSKRRKPLVANIVQPKEQQSILRTRIQVTADSSNTIDRKLFILSGNAHNRRDLNANNDQQSKSIEAQFDPIIPADWLPPPDHIAPIAPLIDVGPIIPVNLDNANQQPLLPDTLPPFLTERILPRDFGFGIPAVPDQFDSNGLPAPIVPIITRPGDILKPTDTPNNETVTIQTNLLRPRFRPRERAVPIRPETTTQQPTVPWKAFWPPPPENPFAADIVAKMPDKMDIGELPEMNKLQFNLQFPPQEHTTRSSRFTRKLDGFSASVPWVTAPSVDETRYRSLGRHWSFVPYTPPGPTVKYTTPTTPLPKTTVTRTIHFSPTSAPSTYGPPVITHSTIIGRQPRPGTRVYYSPEHEPSTIQVVTNTPLLVPLNISKQEPRPPSTPPHETSASTRVTVRPMIGKLVSPPSPPPNLRPIEKRKFQPPATRPDDETTIATTSNASSTVAVGPPSFEARSVQTIKWQAGMRLEAEDPKYPGQLLANKRRIISVASIGKVIDQKRVTIHFDEFSEFWDYTTDVNDVRLHPIGYAKHHGFTLRTPRSYRAAWPFDWNVYLRKVNATFVPHMLFTKTQIGGTPPFQLKRSRTNLNGWQVGQRLEARDPLVNRIRVANIAVVNSTIGTVTVHFDGWPVKEHEFYGYETLVDNIDLHPIGYCEFVGCEVQPPRGSGPLVFGNWSYYLWKENARPVPHNEFTRAQTAGSFPYEFTRYCTNGAPCPRPATMHAGWRTGLKLEAYDRLSAIDEPFKTAHTYGVATVTQVNRTLGFIRVHFDGLSNWWDYELTPPHWHLQPVGTCTRRSSPCKLRPPRGYEGVFEWTKYLRETLATPADPALFAPLINT